MSGISFTEHDVEPLKWAIKYNPAKIALEYHLKPLKSNFLLEIELEEKIKGLSSAQKIADLLYKTYPDILNKQTTPETQLVNLINKIIAHKKGKSHIMTQISPSNKNVNPINTTEVFPKHINNLSHLNPNPLYSSSEEDSKKIVDYSKSNQNFFSSGKNSNINFVDQTNNESGNFDIKNELKQLNNKNRYEEKAESGFDYKKGFGAQNEIDSNLKFSNNMESNSSKRVDRYLD